MGFALVLMFFGIVASVFLLAIFKGWVLTVSWAWFVIPVFHLPELSTVQAIGVCMVAQLIIPTAIPKTDKDKAVENMLYPWLVPVLALGIGWVVKSFM